MDCERDHRCDNYMGHFLRACKCDPSTYILLNDKVIPQSVLGNSCSKGAMLCNCSA